MTNGTRVAWYGSGFGLWLLFLLLLAFGVPPDPDAAAAEEPYTIGVIPTWPPVETHKQWSPFVDRLAQDTGLAFRLKVYEKMRDFEEAIVLPAAPDLLFANALQVVMAHGEQGFLPLVRGGTPIRAVVFVRQDSPEQTADDLAGKLIAFVGEKNL